MGVVFLFDSYQLLLLLVRSIQTGVKLNKSLDEYGLISLRCRGIHAQLDDAPDESRAGV
jgi:hypothetical protein